MRLLNWEYGFGELFPRIYLETWRAGSWLGNWASESHGVPVRVARRLGGLARIWSEGMR